MEEWIKKENPSLYNWCLEQAAARYMGQLTQRQIDLLNAENFPWDYYENELDKLGCDWKMNNPDGVLLNTSIKDKTMKEWTKGERIMNQIEETSVELSRLLVHLTEHLPKNESVEYYKAVIADVVSTLEEVESELDHIGGIACEIDTEEKIRNQKG